MSAVREYLLRLTVAAFFSSILLCIVPNGLGKKAATLLCGLVMLLLALSPLVKLDEQQLAAAISRLELEQEELRTGVEVRNRELIGQIISQRVRAYILDKATQMGMQLEVEITMNTDAATPYPTGVTLHGEATPAQRQKLGAYLEQTFAIAPERQVWLP